MSIFGCVLQACDPSSCELRHVAVKLWVDLCVFSITGTYCKALSLVYNKFLGETLSI